MLLRRKLWFALSVTLPVLLLLELAVVAHAKDREPLLKKQHRVQPTQFLTGLSDGVHRLRLHIFDEDSSCIFDREAQTRVHSHSFTVSLLPASQSLQAFTSYRAFVQLDTEPEIGMTLMVFPADAGPSITASDSMDIYALPRRGNLGPLRFVVLPRIIRDAHPTLQVSNGTANFGEQPGSAIDQLAAVQSIQFHLPDLFQVIDAPIGFAAASERVLSDLRFVGVGLTVDINNDGCFMLTAGLAGYNNGFQPFVIAPFVAFDYSSSTRAVLHLYTTIEAAVNSSIYLTGELGLGLPVSAGFEVRAGVKHTEIALPGERKVEFVDGLSVGARLHL